MMRFNSIRELYNSYAIEWVNHIPFDELSEETHEWWKQKWFEQCKHYKNKTHDYAD